MSEETTNHFNYSWYSSGTNDLMQESAKERAAEELGLTEYSPYSDEGKKVLDRAQEIRRIEYLEFLYGLKSPKGSK